MCFSAPGENGKRARLSAMACRINCFLSSAGIEVFSVVRTPAALSCSPLLHSRSHSADRACGTSRKGQHARFFPCACIAHQRFLPINVQVKRNASNMGRTAAALSNSSLPHVQGHSAACARGCVIGRPARPFSFRAHALSIKDFCR